MMLPIGLSLFSFGYLGGFARREHERHQPALSVEQLLALARTHGLAGIELPLARCYPGLPEDELRALCERLAASGLFLSIDAEVVDDETVDPTLRAAAALGEPFIRVKLSKILGGNRYQSHLSWKAWFEAACRRLAPVAARARDHGVAIAIENHQDVTSEELVRLIREVGEDVVGVNLDTGSTLATCEDPAVFAKAVAPYIRNVHLKDYRLYRGPGGFRLVRCPLGHGVINFQEIFQTLDRVPHAPRASIELGAVVAREVHWLEARYWDAYPPRTVAQMIPFLRLLFARMEPDDGDRWQTPWELGASHEVLERTELEELFESVRFLASLGRGVTPEIGRPLHALSELQGDVTGVPRR